MRKIISAILFVVLTVSISWATFPTEYLTGKPTFFYEDDEFISGTTTSGGIGKQGWVHDGGTSTITTSATTNRPGAIDFTHTTGGASRTICLKDCAATTGIFDFSMDFDTTVIISTPSIGASQYLIYILNDVGNTNSIGFSSNNSTTWYAFCTGCAGTPVSLGVTISNNTWYKLQIKKTGTSVEFYIDDVLKTTLTTTAAGDFQPRFFINWSTTQRTMSIDYWNLIIPSYSR